MRENVYDDSDQQSENFYSFIYSKSRNSFIPIYISIYVNVNICQCLKSFQFEMISILFPTSVHRSINLERPWVTPYTTRVKCVLLCPPGLFSIDLWFLLQLAMTSYLTNITTCIRRKRDGQYHRRTPTTRTLHTDHPEPYGKLKINSHSNLSVCSDHRRHNRIRIYSRLRPITSSQVKGI